MVTDNGPQFRSQHFDVFAESWGFKHKTSSPRYPHAVQRNGRKSCAGGQTNFKNNQRDGADPYLAMLNARNTCTPSNNVNLKYKDYTFFEVENCRRTLV